MSVGLFVALSFTALASPAGGTLMEYGQRCEAQVRNEFGKERGNSLPPTAAQAEQVRTLVADLVHFTSSEAALSADLRERAQALGMELEWMPPPHQDVLVLREGEPRRGWGWLLLRRSRGPFSLIIEAPHPVHDQGTPAIAVGIFEKAQARAVLIAGAHRNNLREPSLQQPSSRRSDPAHSGDTFFHAAHCGLQGPSQLIVQIHGFAARTPEDPEAVLSDGQDDGYDPPALTALQRSLQAAQVRSRVVDFSDNWLTARSNLQGQVLKQHNLIGAGRPSQFVHAELSAELRRRPEFVIEVFADWSRNLDALF